MAIVLSAEQMRAVDRAAIETLGVSGLVLMENAGRGVAEAIVTARPHLASLDVHVVCGVGQNGGDGFVVARHLANRGAGVKVSLVAPRSKIGGDAAACARSVEGMPEIELVDRSGDTDPALWRSHLAGADVIVDAIFGTGLRSDVTGAAASAIAAINESAAFRVSIDLPSGCDADTGATRGIAVKPHLTVTMGCRKLGLVLNPELSVGRLEVADLGVSIPGLVAAGHAHGPLCHWLESSDVGPLLPRPRPSDHKGSAGHLLVIAGSAGKTGAALLAARAALRGGAGLCTIATTGAGQAALDAKVLEVMTARYTDADEAEATSYARVAELASRMRAAAIGPGIPTGSATRAFVEQVVAELPIPLVVDADALNLLGQDLARITRVAAARRVLTPHPGEMARITGVSTDEIQRDRLGCARRLAAESEAIVVLKGARTIVALPGGTAYVNPTANPALATAGSGDVLTGLIGALTARGLETEEAARVAVFIHGAAADRAINALGARTLVAGDLPDAIARALEDELRIDDARRHDTGR